MKRGINKAILLGVVGQDPEVRVMQNAKAVANLSLATSESWKDKNSGEKVEVTEWHRVVIYDRLAEVVRDYVKKGSKIYIEGRLQTRSWEKDGIKRYATEIIADEMQMLDGKKQEGGQPSAPNHKPSQPAATSDIDFDSDVPF